MNVVNQLNPEQRAVYDYITAQHRDFLQYGFNQEQQLLLHINSSAGTSKSFLIEILSSHLAQLTENNQRHNSVIRYISIGVAAHNINGKTIHSLLQFGITDGNNRLTDNQRDLLQTKLCDVRYVIINEKLMISLHMLSVID